MLLILIILSLLFAILFQRLWKNKIGQGVSLTAIYACVWGVMWVIHFSGVMWYYDLSDRALIYSLLPLMGSAFAETLVFLLLPNIKSRKRVGVDIRDNLNPERFKKVVLVLGCISVIVGFVILFSSYQAFGNVLDNAQLIKNARCTDGTDIHVGTTFGVLAKYSNILNGVIFAGCILGGLYMLTINSKYYPALIFPLSGAIMFCLGWGSRSSIFTIILICSAVFICAPIKKYYQLLSSKMIAHIVVFTVLAVIPVIYFLDTMGTSTRQMDTIDVNVTPVPFSIVQFIDYNFGVFVLFDATLDDNSCTYGRMSFAGLEQWLRLLRIIPYSWPLPEAIINWEEEYPYMCPDRDGNVYTWLRYLYSDFGVFGLFAIPFIINLIGTSSAVKFAIRPNSLGYLMSYIVCSLLYLRSTVIMWGRDDSFFLMLFVLAVSTVYLRKTRLDVL